MHFLTEKYEILGDFHLSDLIKIFVYFLARFLSHEETKFTKYLRVLSGFVGNQLCSGLSRLGVTKILLSLFLLMLFPQ